MVHSGYEASAVDDTFGSLKGFLATVRASLSTKHADEAALAMLDEPVHARTELVQLRTEVNA